MRTTAGGAAGLLCTLLVTFFTAGPIASAQETTPQDTSTARESARALGPVTLPAHSGPLPEVLTIRDLVVGRGPALAAGDTAILQYKAADWRTGEELAAIDGEGAVQIPVDQPTVMAAWWQGIPGMRVGGRRMVASPPALAYGAGGQPGVVRPNQTIYFVIDLLDVEPLRPVGPPPFMGWDGRDLIGRYTPFG